MSIPIPVTNREAKLKAVMDVILFTLAAITFVAVGGSLLLIFLQGQKLTDIAEINQRNGQILVDCTTPDGECYKNANRNQSGAIKTINQVSILAAYCAKVPTNVTVAQVQTCVEVALKKEGK